MVFGEELEIANLVLGRVVLLEERATALWIRPVAGIVFGFGHISLEFFVCVAAFIRYTVKNF